ncbi:nuclear transport factor 2 family protein [Nonomuraea wenchangensis]
MNHVTDLVLKYLDIWNERDAEARNALISTTLTEDSIYSDPDYARLQGRGELSDMIGQVQQNFGDLVFTLGKVISAHHGTALFTWKLSPPNTDTSVATGYDVVDFTEDRIRRVVGFFE